MLIYKIAPVEEGVFNVLTPACQNAISNVFLGDGRDPSVIAVLKFYDLPVGFTSFLEPSYQLLVNVENPDSLKAIQYLLDNGMIIDLR